MPNRRPAWIHHLLNWLQTFLLISLLLGIASLVGYLLFGAFGAWVALGASLFSLLIQPAAGTRWMLRLYKAQPIDHEESPGLWRIIDQLAHKAHLPATPRLFHAPSPIVNAFTLGSHKAPVIVLTDGLLRSLNGRELTAVLAHEVSHIVHHDLRVMGLADYASRLTSLMSLFGVIFLFLAMPATFFGLIRHDFYGILLPVFAPQLALIVQLSLSRTREYAADMLSIKLNGDPEGLIFALRKIESVNRSWRTFLLPGWGNPEPSWLRTHPSTEERIRRIQLLAESTPFQDKGDKTAGSPVSLSVHSNPVQRSQHRPHWHIWGLWH